jgi:hypothetical protein
MRNTGSPSGDRSMDQLATRERQAGPFGMAERLVVPMKPGNSGGGKEPQLKGNARSEQRAEGLAMSLTTSLSVQKLQTALHAKAKGSPNFRFYALYDKVYREDLMAFAFECCKANRGAVVMGKLSAPPLAALLEWAQLPQTLMS